ncbi:olfactory receptor 52D1-like [Conger conger]|uniref:olfactory receptor 52D1-like n=1 Tax=Conger conger TaxID=82655 RepID=UPI002A59FD83|nr:olfactory receptor 52D1-like [Conger conger]
MNTASLNVSSILRLQSFDLPPKGVYASFIFATLNYLVILFCNLSLMATIIMNKSLHQPMYLLLFNLPVNDLIGSSALFPQLIKQILLDSGYIEVSNCIVQAFFIHVYGVGSVFILVAMAYDRYMAICNPLKYSTIMTHSHIIRIIALVWLMDLLLMGVLFFLLLRLPRCRSLMSHSYCDNPSLLRLVCADTTINNIYGLCLLASMQVFSVGMIIFTYLQILYACFKSKRPDTKSKAVQTCATHLTVFLLLECLGLFTIISYRIKHLSPHSRRMIGVSTLIFPPTLNPIIYGLKTKEIRQRITLPFRKMVRAIQEVGQDWGSEEEKIGTGSGKEQDQAGNRTGADMNQELGKRREEAGHKHEGKEQGNLAPN